MPLVGLNRMRERPALVPPLGETLTGATGGPIGPRAWKRETLEMRR